MPLELGRSFDREYRLRIPFQETHFNMSVFFHKKTSFLLFKVDTTGIGSNLNSGIKVNMFKFLSSSKFIETFLNVHSYKGENLDIENQFDGVKEDYNELVIPVFNECISLNKLKIKGKDIHDSLNIFGFSLVDIVDNFLFIVAERSNVNSYLKRKVVRTIGLQISTSASIKTLGEYLEIKNE